MSSRLRCSCTLCSPAGRHLSQMFFSPPGRAGWAFREPHGAHYTAARSREACQGEHAGVQSGCQTFFGHGPGVGRRRGESHTDMCDGWHAERHAGDVACEGYHAASGLTLSLTSGMGHRWKMQVATVSKWRMCTVYIRGVSGESEGPCTQARVSWPLTSFGCAQNVRCTVSWSAAGGWAARGEQRKMGRQRECHYLKRVVSAARLLCCRPVFSGDPCRTAQPAVRCCCGSSNTTSMTFAFIFRAPATGRCVLVPPSSPSWLGRALRFIPVQPEAVI